MYAATINDGRLVNRVGLSRKHIFDAVQASVKRLGTYIDVLQIHRLDRNTPREEIMKALNDVVEKGWVRYIGASSVCHHSRKNARLKSTTYLKLQLTPIDGSVGVPSITKCR